MLSVRSFRLARPAFDSIGLHGESRSEDSEPESRRSDGEPRFAPSVGSSLSAPNGNGWDGCLFGTVWFGRLRGRRIVPVSLRSPRRAWSRVFRLISSAWDFGGAGSEPRARMQD